MTTNEQTSAQAVVPVPVRNVYLPGYSDFNTIRALSVRLKMLPQGKRLDDNQRWTWAQFSLSLGLNPFLGESHYIAKGDDDGGAGGMSEGPFVGIAGRVRKSQEQLWREGGHSATMSYEFRTLSEAEKVALAIGTEALAVECCLRDSVTQRDYTARMKDVEFMIKIMIDANPQGDAIAAIQKIVGKPPLYFGVGYLTGHEVKNLNVTKAGVEKKRSHYAAIEKAEKRALNAALKKRFHIQLPEVSFEDLPAHLARVIDAEETGGKWAMVPDVERPRDERESVVEGSDRAAAAAAEALVDQLEQGGAASLRCQCGHVEELHGITRPYICEVADCTCTGIKTVPPLAEAKTGSELQDALARNKRALGRDDGGLT